eukprot:363904-Chlamydomonas_euryale.AAC.1
MRACKVFTPERPCLPGVYLVWPEVWGPCTTAAHIVLTKRPCRTIGRSSARQLRCCSSGKGGRGCSCDGAINVFVTVILPARMRMPVDSIPLHQQKQRAPF